MGADLEVGPAAGPPADPDTATGTLGVFGHYRLDEVIGRGGMGVVYRAYDTRRNRIVAIKRMPRHLATDEEFRTRFKRESALAAKLREPHVVPIHDYGEIDGQLYIDMRLVEGIDLGTVLKRAPLALPRAVDIVSQIADALDAAHEDGLVHRDVKPPNVLLVGKPAQVVDRGFAYLADFGIAANLGGSTLSRPGLALGTASYMAPERMVGDPWDHRVDVYSLACLLFEAVVGHRPYLAEDLLGVLRAHLSRPIPRPTELVEGLPAGLDDVIARGMAKSSDDRFASCGELAAAARELLEGWSPRPAGPDVRVALPAETAEAPLAPISATVDASPVQTATADTPPPTPDAPSQGPATSGDVLAQASAPAHDPVREDGHAGPRRTPAPGPRPSPEPRPVEREDPQTGPTRAFSGPTPALPDPGPETDRTVLGDTHRYASEPQFDLPAAPERRPTPRRRTSPLLIVSGAILSGVALAGVTLLAVFLAQPPAAPLLATVATYATGAAPAEVALSPDGSRAYVTNQDSGTVSVIDTRTGRPVVAPIRVGERPNSVRVTADGTRVLVTSTSGSVAIIEAATHTVAATVPVAGFVDGLALSPDGARLYACIADTGTVVTIDVATARQVGRPIKVGDQPYGMAASTDGRRLYVPNFGSDDLSVVDTTTGAVVGTVKVGDAPVGAVVSPDGTRLYVANLDGGTVSIIDTATVAVIGTVAVGPTPVGLAVSSDGRRLFISQRDTDSVRVLTTADRALSGPIAVPAGPVSIAVAPDGRLVVVGERADALSVLRPGQA
ncbi:protein kinase domain-containing protein [Pseudonocardia sp. CA-107938]|uniref:serine/threonine-protein kinase n=1 Tax=Pseudonocardia sp. CA-107938 TaxID=3240021 RepID=UPI003D8BE21D